MDYICPVCHGGLQVRESAWLCTACGRLYPVREGIPDFLEEELALERAVSSRQIRFMDRSMGWLSKIYESRLWYPLFIDLIFGWKRASLVQITNWMRAAIPAHASHLLDVACGPATYGRRLAAPGRVVYGVDASLGMLKQGKRYLNREGISNVFLARSLAEKLPFPENGFDAALCSGSLHLFRDPGRVLADIWRCLKPGAPLAVMTIIKGESGILRSDLIRKRFLDGMRVFERPEIVKMLSQTGFDGFDEREFGSGIFFVTRKGTKA